MIPAHPGIQYHFCRVGVPVAFLGNWDQFQYWRPRPPNVRDLLSAFRPEQPTYTQGEYERLLTQSGRFDLDQDFAAAWLHFPWQAKMLLSDRRLPKIYCVAKWDELSRPQWGDLLSRDDFHVAAFYPNTKQYLESTFGVTVPWIPLGLDPDTYRAHTERRPIILTVIHSWAQRGWRYDVYRNGTSGLPTLHVDHLDRRQPTRRYPDLLALFQSAQIYLHDGEQEYTIALVEALMSGLPVVTFDLPGVDRYVRDGVNGFVCRTAKEIRECCSVLLADKDLCQEFGRASRELALAVFNEARWRNEWIRVINSATGVTRIADERPPRS